MGRSGGARQALEENATPVNNYQSTDEDLPEILQPANDAPKGAWQHADIAVIPNAAESQIVRPILSPEKAKEEWKTYTDTCQAILDESDYTWMACARKPDGYDLRPVAFRTKKEAEAQLEIWRKQGFRDLLVRPAKRRSAWDKLARFYGISTPIESKALCSLTEITEVGAFIIEKLVGDSFTVIKYQDAETLTLRKVNVLLRVVAPNGRTILGDGACSVSERKHGAESFSHVDHDVFSTAFTRAMNRGISRCIGTGEVSAEEFEDSALTNGGASANVESAPLRDIPKAEQSPAAATTAAVPTPASNRSTAASVKPEEKSEAASPQGSSTTKVAYQPLPEAAKDSARVTAMEIFCFGKSPCDDRTIRYLIFAAGTPSALTGPFLFERNGKMETKTWGKIVENLPGRKERIAFMEKQLELMGKELFIDWALALVQGARNRGVFGK